MTHDECRSELWLWAQRGTLSTEDELGAWENHRASCAHCRLAHQLAHDFEAEAVHEPDDGDRLARLAATAVRVHAARLPTPWLGRKGGWRRSWVIGAGLLGTFAAAAATVSYTLPPARGDLTQVPPVDEAALRPAARVAPTPPAGSTALSLMVEPPAAASAVTSTELPLPPLAAGEPAPGADAAELYRLASEARRAGNRSKAIRLYRALQQGFPSSPQASLSAVSLGGLLLDSGSARGALAQFDRHLTSPGPQRLAAEALYGKGRALSALGQKAEEVNTWQRLVREYPACPYVSHARRRLDVLTP